MNLALIEFESPVGTIRTVSTPRGVCDLDFSDRWEKKRSRLERRYGSVAIEPGDPLDVASRLRAYFAGDLAALDDLATDPGGTAFQRSVWSALRRIPPGETRSYGDLAAQIGNRHASRAVGAANGQNPIAIVVPCHRVIGAAAHSRRSGGSLTAREKPPPHASTSSA
jgi:methylated-DNA-[protein]-cysteine S-methyltransferase